MLLQFLISGVSNGALYALIAFGFVAVFNVAFTINFPQGFCLLLGGFFALMFLEMNLPLPAAVVLAIVVVTLIGIFTEQLTLARIRKPTFNVVVLVMCGICYLYEGIMNVAFGKYPKPFPPFTMPLGVKFFNAFIATQSLWMIGVTLVLGIALWYFFSRQLYGRAMRATAQNRTAARLVGINTRTMVTLSFALSSALGAISGIVVAPLTYVVYNVGWPLTMRGLMAAVIGGGLISYAGAFVGGFVIGLVEALTIGYVTSLFKDAVLFAILLAILIWRPAGILGNKSSF